MYADVKSFSCQKFWQQHYSIPAVKYDNKHIYFPKTYSSGIVKKLKKLQAHVTIFGHPIISTLNNPCVELWPYSWSHSHLFYQWDMFDNSLFHKASFFM